MKYISVKKKIPGIMICGTGSGCGKTSVTSAVMGALIKKGLEVQGYKCGCDYIDPMFHKYVTGRKSYNLDKFFCNENTLKMIMGNGFKNADIAVVEGVMGYYDGTGYTSTASSYDISVSLGIPSLLVVNAGGMARSVAAMIKGYTELESDNRIKGVILNNIKDAMYPFYKNIIENELENIEVLGYMPQMQDVMIQSRHLGLKTADEVENIDRIMEILSEKALETINIDRIIQIAYDTDDISYSMPDFKSEKSFRLSIARDKAFCFYYNENIELLENLGADITYFSPVNDEKIPENSDGIYLGGGYPELYLKELSSNKKMLESIKNAYNKGMPVIAECGGFMYLHESMEDKNGNIYSMAGIINGKSFLTDKLVRFGYAEAEAQCNGIIADKGDIIKVHEFHYSDSTSNGCDFTVRKTNGRQYNSIHMKKNLFAGYPHMYFYSDMKIAEKFAESCRMFSERRKNIC